MEPEKCLLQWNKALFDLLWLQRIPILIMNNNKKKFFLCKRASAAVFGSANTTRIQWAVKTTKTITTVNTHLKQQTQLKHPNKLKRTFRRVRHVLRLFPDQLRPWPIYGQPTPSFAGDDTKIITKYLIEVTFFFEFHVWFALSVRRTAALPVWVYDLSWSIDWFVYMKFWIELN